MRTCLCLASLGLMLGCGSAPAPSDAGVPDLANTVDAAVDLSARAVTGTRLRPGGTQLVGLTSDGLIVLLDDSSAVAALPLAGGAAQIVSPAPPAPNQTASTLGRLVLVFPSANFSTGVSGLATWTAAQGLKTVATTTVLYAGQAASADGNWILYFDNASADGSAGDLTVAKIDGSMKRVLAAGVSTNAFGTPCSPQIDFAKSVFVYATCPATPADAGQVPVTIATLDPATGATQTLLASGASFAISPAGDQVLLTDSLGNLSVVSPPSATPTPIDSSVAQAFFAPDGSVIYLGATLAHATLGPPVVKSALQSPPGSPPVFPSSFVSPDSKWFGFSTMFDPNGNGNDYWLGSTNPAQAPTSVEAKTTVAFGGTFGAGDPFTQDSKQALFFEPFDVNTFTGTLKSIPVGGGAPTTWGTPPTSWVLAAAGGKIVFTDQWVKSGTSATADLRAADTAGALSPPALLAAQADTGYLLTPDGKSVLYTTHAAGLEGLYSTPLP